MQTKLKNKSDINRTGNKQIKILKWEQQLYDLWHKDENSAHNKIPDKNDKFLFKQNAN